MPLDNSYVEMVICTNICIFYDLCTYNLQLIIIFIRLVRNEHCSYLQVCKWNVIQFEFINTRCYNRTRSLRIQIKNYFTHPLQKRFSICFSPFLNWRRSESSCNYEFRQIFSQERKGACSPQKAICFYFIFEKRKKTVTVPVSNNFIFNIQK